MFVFKVAFYDDTGGPILVVPVEANDPSQAWQEAQLRYPEVAIEAKSIRGWAE